MKSTDNAGYILEWQGYKGQWAWRAVGVVGTPVYTGAIYIHPDSLHLLEPKVGDIVRVGDAGCIARYCRADQANHFIQIITPGSSSNANWTDQVYALLVRDTSIIVIQRDGKPFMWPESEAA